MKRPDLPPGWIETGTGKGCHLTLSANIRLTCELRAFLRTRACESCTFGWVGGFRCPLCRGTGRVDARASGA